MPRSGAGTTGAHLQCRVLAPDLLGRGTTPLVAAADKEHMGAFSVSGYGVLLQYVENVLARDGRGRGSYDVQAGIDQLGTDSGAVQ